MPVAILMALCDSCGMSALPDGPSEHDPGQATNAADTSPFASTADVLPDAPFSEHHTRRVELPFDDVWPAMLAVQGSEIRPLAALMKLRGLPGRIARRDTYDEPRNEEPFLDEFAAVGATILHRDDEPVGARVTVMLGGAGRFWKPVGNRPIKFATPDEFLDFAEPGFARFVSTIEAVDRGDHVELITETRITGTDRNANRRFAPYWVLIRLPSGLIRRSWLVAIERRASAKPPAGLH